MPHNAHRQCGTIFSHNGTFVTSEENAQEFRRTGFGAKLGKANLPRRDFEGIFEVYRRIPFYLRQPLSLWMNPLRSLTEYNFVDTSCKSLKGTLIVYSSIILSFFRGVKFVDRGYYCLLYLDNSQFSCIKNYNS